MTPCDAVALELEYGVEVSPAFLSSCIIHHIIYLPSQVSRVGGDLREIVEMWEVLVFISQV